jgi:hypothetical protein
MLPTAASTGTPAARAEYRFAAGARERFAGTYFDRAYPLGAAQVNLDVIDIAAGDFTAGIYLHCTALTAGNAAVVAFAADAPWSVIQQVELLDPTGTSFQTLSGWELFIENALGGWTGQSIRNDSPNYVATAGVGAGLGGSFGFFLRIPAELFPRDAVGALFNGNTAAQFKVRITQAPSTAVYTTPPTALPSVRYRVNSHGYQVPNAAGPKSGIAYAPQPPGGQVYQMFYRQVVQFSGAGNQIIQLQRKGFLLRQIIFVQRDATGARVNTIAPTDWVCKFDNVDVFSGSFELMRETTWERNRYNTGANLPAGVTQLSWCFDGDGVNGGETRDQYVPTQPGSILEVRLTTAAAGSLTILTNDVSPTDEAIQLGIVKV